MKSTHQEQVEDLGRIQNELMIQNRKLYAHCFELENCIAQLNESNREIERTKDIEIATLKDQLSIAQLELERQKVQMLTTEADWRKMDFEVFQLQAVKFNEQMLALDNKVKQLEQSKKIAEDEKIQKIAIEDHPMKQSEMTIREQESQKLIDKLQQRVLDLEKEKITHKWLTKQVQRQQQSPQLRLNIRDRAQSLSQHESKLNQQTKEYHQLEYKQQQTEQQQKQ